MKVYIAQVLCPQRHCIIGTAGSVEDDVLAEHRAEWEAAIQEQIWEMLRSALGEQPEAVFKEKLPESGGRMNSWCLVCGAKVETWTVEVGLTRFLTLEEAGPAIQKCEAEQADSRRFVECLHGLTRKAGHN